MAYAEKTEVPAERSRAEIERTLQRYGADSFMYGWEQDRAVVQFRAQNRYVRFVVGMPDRNDKKFTHYTRGQFDLVSEVDPSRLFCGRRRPQRDPDPAWPMCRTCLRVATRGGRSVYWMLWRTAEDDRWRPLPSVRMATSAANNYRFVFKLAR